jgi:hypothetical protein
MMMQEIELKPMSVSQVQEHGLTLASTKTTATGWWSGSVDVPDSAWVLDFVVSNKSKSVWDNNNSKDYHTQVAGEESCWRLGFPKLKLQRQDYHVRPLTNLYHLSDSVFSLAS